jgi:hypothetical protein
VASFAARAYSAFIRNWGQMAKEIDPSIMAEMSSQRSSTTQVIAACLPLCLVWVFVACVSLCAVRADGCEKPLAEELGASHEASHCPITEAIEGLIPERQTSSQQVIIQAILPDETIAADSYRPISATGLLLPSSSDPPLELLGVLRI